MNAGKFEIGKTYEVSECSDGYTTVWPFEVIARTEKYITFKDKFGETFRCKLSPYFQEYEGVTPKGWWFCITAKDEAKEVA